MAAPPTNSRASDPESLFRHRIWPQRLAHRSQRPRRRQGTHTQQSRNARSRDLLHDRGQALARSPRRTPSALRIPVRLFRIRADRRSARRATSPRWPRRRHASLRPDYRRATICSSSSVPAWLARECSPLPRHVERQCHSRPGRPRPPSAHGTLSRRRAFSGFLFALHRRVLALAAPPQAKVSSAKRRPRARRKW